MLDHFYSNGHGSYILLAYSVTLIILIGQAVLCKKAHKHLIAQLKQTLVQE